MDSRLQPPRGHVIDPLPVRVVPIGGVVRLTGLGRSTTG
jgi:hypothetical protein